MNIQIDTRTAQRVANEIHGAQAWLAAAKKKIATLPADPATTGWIDLYLKFVDDCLHEAMQVLPPEITAPLDGKDGVA